MISDRDIMNMLGRRCSDERWNFSQSLVPWDTSSMTCGCHVILVSLAERFTVYNRKKQKSPKLTLRIPIFARFPDWIGIDIQPASSGRTSSCFVPENGAQAFGCTLHGICCSFSKVLGKKLRYSTCWQVGGKTLRCSGGLLDIDAFNAEMEVMRSSSWPDLQQSCVGCGRIGGRKREEGRGWNRRKIATRSRTCQSK